MNPVAIFRHFPSEGPGYIAEFLDQEALSWHLVRIDAGQAVPRDADAYSGLVFMGGPMSVNDDLPWIAPVLELIRHAVALDIPVLGHCLGGQLIAKALGGKVTRNPVKEIGWGEAEVADNDTARAWFGEVKTFEAFHWHGESFSLPPGAEHILSSAHCINQGFALGKHLGLQCHVEMTENLIHNWCAAGAAEIASSAASPGVQSAAAIQAQTAINLPQLHAVARQLYSGWIGGLAA